MCRTMHKLAFPKKDQLEAKRNPPIFGADGRVFGTWDFKWPAESVIDVAFAEPDPTLVQELSGQDFGFTDDAYDAAVPAEQRLGSHKGLERLTRIVECLVRRWLVPPQISRATPLISFKFHHAKRIDAADSPKPDAPLPRVTVKHPELAYDVLVSLDALPRYRPLFTLDRKRKRGDLKFFLPSSELGRYAQRLDYGFPTTYLGKRQHHGASSVEYFKSPEFHHWVLHEFGHVLGMPHEHQNPRINRQIQGELLPVKDLLPILREALGYDKADGSDITEAEIKQEINSAWQTLKTGGEILFSDFRYYRSGDAHDDTTSVMFHLFWQRLLRKNQSANPPAPAGFHAKPTERDLEMLGRMYPRSLEQQALEAAE